MAPMGRLGRLAGPFAPAFILTSSSLCAAVFADPGSSSALEGRKISAVTALLPPRGKRGAGATLRLEAFGGCYQWSSQQPELVQVETPKPLEPGAEALECMERKALECMDRGPVLGRELFGAKMEEPEVSCQPVAILRSVAQKLEGGEKVLVFARDMSSPQVELRCEVYLAHVDRVEVETRVRRINVDDVETVSAKAYDSNGNVFSSLEGLEFEWQVSDPSVLRVPSVVDTAFKLSPERRSLAVEGIQSDTLLLHGLATGRASVSASLPVLGGKAVTSPAVELTVSESIFAVPSAVRVPPMAHLQLQLKVLRGASRPLEQYPEVSLPVKHFAWDWSSVEGAGDVLHVPADTGVVVAQRLGRGRVVVRDLRIENNSAVSLVDVVEPARLQVTPLPLGNTSGAEAELEEAQLRPPPGGPTSWYFVQGRKYMLRLELLDANSQAMHIPGNFRATMRCKMAEGREDPCPLHVVRQTPNSALVVVSADALGTGTLTYGKASVQADDGDKARGFASVEWPSLSVEQTFHVVAPLRLQSPFPGPLVLPPLHSYRLRVSGGSGSYVFTLANAKPQSLCTVSSTGTVQASTLVGSAELFVSDARNAANNFTLQVLVRRPGGIALRPPQLQLQLPSEASEAPAAYSVPVLARPEAVEGDRSDSAAWRALRFWSCSGLRESGPGEAAEAAVAESSHPAVAEASVVPKASGESLDEGVCATISVLPRAPGVFTLSGRLGRRGAGSGGAGSILGRGERLSATVDLQVFAPLEVVVQGAAKATEALVAPCSSLRFQLMHGPGEMQVPGQAFRNLSSELEGTHLRVRRLGDGAFEVLCLRPTPGRARLVAEVRHEPEDREVHGGPVVARGSAWISCVQPYSIEIVPASSSQDAESVQAAPPTAESGSGIGLRRGQTQRFDVRFFDSENRSIASASEFQPRWSIEEGKQWLAVKGRLAAVTAPASAADGTAVSLRAQAVVPSSEQCAKAHGLDAQQQAIAKEALAGLSAPLPDVLRLRATTDIEVRWPGYPSRRFAFAPNWAYVFEVSQGSGSSSLTVGSPAVAEAVEPSEICGTTAANASGCIAAVQAEVSTPGAVARPVRPVSPGHTKLTFEDRGQLGGAPEVVSASFLPIGRIALSLSGMDSRPSARGAPLLIVGGKAHALRVEVWDSENQTLPPASWQPAGLRVEASGSGLEVAAGPEKGSYSVIGRASGAFEVQALAHNHPSAVLYSNTLYIHVFETFGIEPQEMVVLPGQTFEFAVQGGPAASSAGSAHVSFSSSSAGVAEVRPADGLLSARKPGRSTVSARLAEASTGRVLAQAAANVTVVLPDAASIQPVQFGLPSRRADAARPLVLVRGASDPLRLAALLSSKGLPLSLPLLTAPTGAAEEGRASHGCSFRWTSSDPSVSLLPSTTLGAVAIDVVVAEGAAGSDIAEGSVDVSVAVSCPGVARLEATRRLMVMSPLRLVAPSTAAASSGGPLLLALPPLGRVPLIFSRPREHLQVQLTGLRDVAGGGRPVVELLENGSSVELAAGAVEGEALLVVEDPRSESGMPTLLISVAVRTPQSVHLDPRPRRLPAHAVADCRVSLVDARGTLLTLPPNYAVTHYTSHPSVLASELVRTANGETILRMSAVREGCAAVGMEVKAPGPEPSAAVGAEALAVCVGRGAVVGQAPLLVQPGARLHLPAEHVVTGPEDSQALAFSVRLGCAAGSSPLGSEELARDIQKALKLKSGSVRVLGSTWAPSAAASCGCAAALDVDLEVAGDLPQGSGLQELADALWFPADQQSVGPALQHLDRAYGLRAPSSVPSSCPSSPQSGWSSSAPSVLEVDASGLEAVARRPGRAVATFNSTSISASVDVEVARLAEAVLEAPSGTPLVELSGREGEGRSSFISNVFGRGSLVVPLRFFALAAEGGGGDLRELRSGPFQTQDVDFACVPAEAELRDFFDFEPWSLANLSAAEPGASSATPFPASTATAAQAACVLRPRRTEARRWAERMPPHVAELKVVVTNHDAGLPIRPSTRASVQWPFLPQFAAMDDSGKQLDTYDICATLTPSEPVATAWVWTGGQPVEVAMERQLKESLGRVSLHVRSSPPNSAVPTPSMSVTIAWESPVAWPGVEDLILVLESRTSGQVERLRVRVQGAPPGAAAGAAAAPGFADEPERSWLQAAVALFARGLPFLLVLFLCQRCCAGCCASLGSGGRRRQQAPRQPPAAAAGLFGPVGLRGPADAELHGQERGSLACGPSPFRRVDLRR